MSDAVIFCGAAALSWNPDFLHAARARGLRVLAVETPAARYADSALLTGDSGPDALAWVDAGETSALLAVVRDWARAYEVVGICALREDWVEPVGLAADLLETPGIGLRASRACRDKSLQRGYLAAWSPRHTVLPPGDRGAASHWDGFPAVLKPTGRSASSGVVALADRDGLRQALTAYPDDEPLLLEERVYGPEFSVESLVRGGDVVFSGITGKRTTEETDGGFVEVAHTVPADVSAPLGDALLEANRQVLRRLDVRDGIIHAEYRVTDTGRVVLTEVNGRCPGGSIPALYRLATGASLEDAVVALAVGQPVTMPAPRRWARQVYVRHRPGVLEGLDVAEGAPTPVWLAEEGVRRIPGPADRSEPGTLRAITVIKPRGALLGRLTSNQDRAVTYIVDAPDIGALDAQERSAEAALHLRVGAVEEAPAAVQAPGATR
ncbi:ATP-grasp domain-containing protein [Streptacidiphilus melanogenes]|uniref:ATP-grasp domain-containing protein n=1 Tax=Streptacidiphilus melanogenes TaxID=411235 RepID=UPI0005A61D9C|nr:ATP-grasp domain-containing protein [Streptacidiphilus melanogenes]